MQYQKDVASHAQYYALYRAEVEQMLEQMESRLGASQQLNQDQAGLLQ